jgi:hypothetical protein
MANYYYRDANRQRQGPFDEQQLRALVEQGTIAATTYLETDRKCLGLAKQFRPDWIFAKQTQEYSVDKLAPVKKSANNPFVPPFLICIVAGVLLCIGGLIQVFAVQPTLGDVMSFRTMDESEIYFRKMLTSPVLLIGLVTLIVGIFGILFYANSGNKGE